MRIHLHALLNGLVLCTLAGSLCGCASTSWKNPLAGLGINRLGLPSPWATVKQADNQVPLTPGPNDAQPIAQAKALTDAEKGRLAMELLRGRNLERTGDMDKARRVYEDLHREFPEDVEVIHRLGVVADQQRRHADAEGYFQQALLHRPQDGEILADLGYCYFLQGKLNKAESAILKAVASDPKNPRYRNNLGLVQGHQGRYDEALANFRAASPDADAFFNLAFVYASQNQADKAKKCFQLALTADPTHSRAQSALQAFHEYERTPADLRDEEMVVKDGVKYVPYVEGSENQAGESAVSQASAESPLPMGRDASRATRSLYLEARGTPGSVANQRGDAGAGPIE